MSLLVTARRSVCVAGLSAVLAGGARAEPPSAPPPPAAAAAATSSPPSASPPERTAPADQAAADLDLQVSVAVARTQGGALMIALFDSEAAYEAGDRPVRAERAPVSGPDVAVTFKGLKPGRYAIKMFHDLNGDGKLGLNLFGVPTEPVAFSNNAKISMRAPTWAQTAFDLQPGAQSQSILID